MVILHSVCQCRSVPELPYCFYSDVECCTHCLILSSRWPNNQFSCFSGGEGPTQQQEL